MTIKRIGFACIYSEIHSKKGVISVPEYNLSGTTVSWLNRQTRDVAVEKLWNILKSNLQNAYNLVNKVGSFDPSLRMVRIGSDVLPVYTHRDWSWFWKQPDVRAYCEKSFAVVGAEARKKNVRLSFHPGQFCCIVSDDSDIVDRSVEELEYHTDMIRWMGFGISKLDFKLNIHLSGRRGVDGFSDAWNKMSPELRNCLTLENDEYQKGLDDLLTLKDKVGIVLDIHHHLIKKEEYIQSSDSRIQQVIESWRGVRPTIHYSQSREDYLDPQVHTGLPQMSVLLQQGYRKQKLRAHSDYMWNNDVNDWALTHSAWADILVEAKKKNLASHALYSYAKENGYFSI
jgi:UV DNA damage repair endonuclease